MTNRLSHLIVEQAFNHDMSMVVSDWHLNLQTWNTKSAVFTTTYYLCINNKQMLHLLLRTVHSDMYQTVLIFQFRSITGVDLEATIVYDFYGLLFVSHSCVNQLRLLQSLLKCHHPQCNAFLRGSNNLNSHQCRIYSTPAH